MFYFTGSCLFVFPKKKGSRLSKFPCRPMMDGKKRGCLCRVLEDKRFPILSFSGLLPDLLLQAGDSEDLGGVFCRVQGFRVWGLGFGV